MELQYFDATLGCSWDATLLNPMAELNAEILEALVGGAARPGASGAEGGLQWQWRALGEPARVRVARCPFLLVDAGLAQPELWAGLPGAAVHEAVPLRTLLARRGPLATPLLRRLLLFAWHLARAYPLGARIALGMSAPCARAVAGCRLAVLEALAEQRPAWIRPRWEDRPELWKIWLSAAAEESPRGLERLQLWGLQSLAAEVLARRT